MKSVKVLVMVVLVLFSIGASSQTKRGYGDTAQHTKLYTCPMHDTVASKQPGNCPVCGMKLTLSKKEAAHVQSKNYVCPSHPEQVSDQPGKCAKCGMNLNLSTKERAKLGYYCPMHPNVKSDKDGKCPNCGMALTPVKKGK